MIRPLTTYKSYVSDEVTTWMVDVYATGDAECLEPVGSDPSIQAGSAIGDRRVGAARSPTSPCARCVQISSLAMKVVECPTRTLAALEIHSLNAWCSMPSIGDE